MTKNHYKTLQVPEDATHEEIKKSYKNLSKKYHPDKQGGDSSMQKSINAAYHIIGDEHKRILYDKNGDVEQILCSVEEMAIIKLKEAFFKMIKINFEEGNMFRHTREFINNKLDELAIEKRSVEENLSKLKMIISRLEKLRDTKIKPGMIILEEVITEELLDLNKLLESVDLGKINYDIEVYERILDILSSDYPVEELFESYYVGLGFRIK